MQITYIKKRLKIHNVNQKPLIEEEQTIQQTNKEEKAKEEFEDTKGVIRIRKSKDRQQKLSTKQYT